MSSTPPVPHEKNPTSITMRRIAGHHATASSRPHPTTPVVVTMPSALSSR
jgi:hypothetical protein